MNAGVIFDMDGVLVDSGRAHHESWRRVGEELGLQVTAEEFQKTFGRSSRDIIRILFGASRSEDEVRRIDDRKEALYRGLVRDAMPVMPGAVELIHGLRSAGFRLAIGSSGPPENIDLVVRSLGILKEIDAIVTGFDVRRGKPDPEVFLIAAARLRLSPASCAVVEDAPAGIEAAHRAGMCCVALSSSHPRSELAQADRVVEGLDAIDVISLLALLGIRGG